jgi:PAS domain S-box-containing protein
VVDERGRPAVGSRLEGSAYSALFKEGKSYRGESVLLGQPYLTAYDPIRDDRHRIIGALFVGVKKSSFQEQFEAVNSPIVIMLALLLSSLGMVTLLLLRLSRNFESAESDHLRLLRTLMDTIPSPIYYKDVHGRYLGFNKAYEAYVGITQDKLVGKTAHDLWPKDLADRYEQQDNNLRENPGAQMYEGSVVYADGTRHDVIFHKGSFLSEAGAYAGSVGVILDITERKAAEQQILNSNRRLHDIVEFLPDATFVVDAGGRVIAWNKSMEEMTGVKKEQMIGQGDYAYAVPFYGERRPILIDLIDRDPEQAHADYPFLKREGSKLFTQTLIPSVGGRASRYVWGTAAPLFDSDGNKVGGIESMRDITEQKDVEEQLRLKNLVQATQLECSIDGIVAADEAGRILSYNRRFQELFQIPQPVLDAGGEWTVVKTAMERAENPQQFLETVQKIYEHQQDTSRDELLLKGGMVIDQYSAPMMDAERRYHGRVWYFRDITEQKHAEEVRLRLEAQRHHSQMMESFITQLGHDLRTPLTPIFALVPLIKAKICDEQLSTMIDICHQSVITVHELTEKALRLVQLSASTEGLLQHVQLADQVARCIEDGDPLLRENGAGCRNEVDPELVVVVVPEQLRELLGNLISNAARHSRTGGVIAISAKPGGDMVTVAVQDQGEGVEPADLERIFDEFFKVDASRHDVGSPGLGLAICRRIVANHQGAIWAESGGKGCGLTVRFTVPAQ